MGTNEYACHTHVTMKGCFLNPLIQTKVESVRGHMQSGYWRGRIYCQKLKCQWHAKVKGGKKNPIGNVVDSSYERLMGFQDQMI